MRRFFVQPEQIEEPVIHITGGDVNHICHVLRMGQGDTLVVGNIPAILNVCRIKR